MANIAATAFQAMELAPFSSFADDTPQAQDAATQYKSARRQCIEACDWSFASTVANLPPIADLDIPSDPDLPGCYKVPGDCLVFRHPLNPFLRYRLDGRHLRADTSNILPVRYTRDIDNENLMTASFQQAVALRLAAMLSPRWVGAESKTRALEDRADLALQRAMRLDARSASLERYDGADFGVQDWAGWAIR